MKKITTYILLWAMIAFGYEQTIAQNPLCNDPCPPGPVDGKKIDLCSYTDGTDTAGLLLVFIYYRIRTCNGVTSVIIESYVLVDSRYLLSSNPSFYPVFPCPWPDPLPLSDYRLAINDAISQLVNLLGLPAQNTIDVYFPGACFSIAQLSFPDSAFIVGTPNDLGKIDTTYLHSGSNVAYAVRCNDACCKATYKWVTKILENGYTLQFFEPISYDGDGGQCEGQPIPDYNSVSPQYEATMYDPVTGQYITVTGTLVSQTNCESMCPNSGTNPPTTTLVSVKSDILLVNDVLELKASPMPFNNYIQISANRTAEKVVVYDNRGNKIISTTEVENGIINTAELKSGIYFIQVYFDGNIVKTLRAIKD